MNLTANFNNISKFTRLGVCGVEALWLESVRGTHYLKHPVARTRAKAILDQARSAISDKYAPCRINPKLTICK